MTKTGFLICFLFIVNKAFAQVDNLQLKMPTLTVI